VQLCEYVLRFVGSAVIAEDLVHDLFLRLWDSRARRGGMDLTRSYLYVAARNRALKYLRHRRVVAAWIERAAREETPTAASPGTCICGASLLMPSRARSPSCRLDAVKCLSCAATSTSATTRSPLAPACRSEP